MSIPLLNTTARNNYKASRLAKEQALLGVKKLEEDIITEVDNAVKQAETNFKQIGSTKKARDTAELALAAVRTQYEAGTLTAFFVVEAREKLTKASFAYIRALADYNIALAQLSLSDGTTIEKNHLTVKLKQPGAQPRDDGGFGAQVFYELPDERINKYEKTRTNCFTYFSPGGFTERMLLSG